MKNLKEIRKEFPELERLVHLSSAALSLMPERSKQAMIQALTDREYTSEKRTAVRKERDLAARREIAALIHASAEDICMVANTSEGLNILAQGLDLQAGDNVVLSEIEFSGNIIPWLNLEKKGVRIKRAKTEFGQDPTEKILAAIDGRTRLVTLSFVGWIDGFKTNVAEIGAYCRERGIIFVVDGIQGVGVMELNVTAAQVSFLSCGGQKWLMSPNGTGFIYVAKSVLPLISQKYLGYLSIDNEADNTFDFALPLKGDAARFQIGAVNDKGIAAMERSLSLILETGIADIQDHVIGLNRYAGEGLRKMGYTLVSDRRPDHMSSILSFWGDDTLGAYHRLTRKGVIVSLRNGWIRVSPHLYNTEQDIDKFLAAL